MYNIDLFTVHVRPRSVTVQCLENIGAHLLTQEWAMAKCHTFKKKSSTEVSSGILSYNKSALAWEMVWHQLGTRPFLALRANMIFNTRTDAYSHTDKFMWSQSGFTIACSYKKWKVSKRSCPKQPWRTLDTIALRCSGRWMRTVEHWLLWWFYQE